jgi:hypothetical protein
LVARGHYLACAGKLPLVFILAMNVSLRYLELDTARTPLYFLAAIFLIGLPLLIMGNYLGSKFVYRMGMRVNIGRLLEPPLVPKAVALVRRRFGVEVLK